MTNWKIDLTRSKVEKIRELDADQIAEKFGEQLAADPRDRPDASSGWRREYRHQGVAPGGHE